MIGQNKIELKLRQCKTCYDWKRGEQYMDLKSEPTHVVCSECRSKPGVNIDGRVVAQPSVVLHDVSDLS